MILSISNLCKSYDGKDILKDVSFHMEEHDKLGITGVNGAGKTTLLRLITGKEQPDRGSVSFSGSRTFCYLPQNPEIRSEQTIYNEILSSKADLLRMEERLRSMELEMKTADPARLEELYKSYSHLSHVFETEGGYAVRSNVTGVLKGLGFSEDDFDKKVSLLSGGQKTRLLLGKLLITEPDVLILDEPTNHLDLKSMVWLENYLRSSSLAVILVTHDRYFMDRIVNKVLDIEGGTARLYTGNYSDFAVKKEAERKTSMRAWLNNQAEIRHQEEVIAKLRRFNREKSIRRAESREKALAKTARVQKPFVLDDAMKLHFTACSVSGFDVLNVWDLAKSYGDLSLFQGVSFEVKRGEKLAVIGANGTGKTTLLKIIVGLEHADSGEVEPGAGVRMAYYDQEHHVLDDRNTVFDEISDAYPDMTNTEIRSLLASFLFTGDDVFKLVGELSGGEKGRLSLCKLMLSKANLLLLDEPTNHLDMSSKQILEEALNSYDGTVIYVSHDRYFINSTATRILELEDGSFANYAGNYDYYLEKKADPSFDRSRAIAGSAGGAANNGDKKAPASAESGASAESSARLSFAQQKERRQKLQKLENALKRCEDDIRKLEERNAVLEGLMALPENAVNSAKLNELNGEAEQNMKRLETLYEEWETRSEELESFRNGE